MKKVFLALALMAEPALCWGDGDGVEILPFTSGGGICIGAVSVYADGTATVSGQLQGVPFTSEPWAHAKPGPDGSYWFEVLLSDGDLLVRQKFWIPLQLHFTGTLADSQDGDDTDDPAGEITVRSQTGMGRGSIKLTD